MPKAYANEQDDLDKLRQRISAMQQELEKTSESKSEAADALRESESAISDSNRKLRALSNQQRDAADDLARLQAKSSRLKQDMQGLQARLAALLYQQYLEGQQEYLQLMLGNNQPDQAARDLQYYGYIARAQAAWLNTLRDDLAQLDALSAQARRKSDELGKLQQAAAKQKAALENDRQARQQVLLRISARIRQQNREIGRLQRNENRLAQLVERLARMFAQSNSSPFESLRGKLALPVKGHVGNKFGTRRPGSPALWKGWFVRVPAGQEVKAVAAGKVVFADWLRGFGNLLIIDHGKGYMSLYGNNETLYKQVGDTLRGGDVIAASGSSGGNEDSGLYFELRHEGKPIDPAKWVAKR
ncbi:MAG TPA: peptidoglycan DD-metalloendopeptidase family protein [Gallionellaceae bacterium]